MPELRDDLYATLKPALYFTSLQGYSETEEYVHRSSAGVQLPAIHSKQPRGNSNCYAFGLCNVVLIEEYTGRKRWRPSWGDVSCRRLRWTIDTGGSARKQRRQQPDELRNNVAGVAVVFSPLAI